jgi:hypothetical protein
VLGPKFCRTARSVSDVLEPALDLLSVHFYGNLPPLPMGVPRHIAVSAFIAGNHCRPVAQVFNLSGEAQVLGPII